MSAVALQGHLVEGRSLNQSECSRLPTRDCALKLPAAIRNLPNTRCRAISKRRCMAAMTPACRAEGRKGLHRAPRGHVLGAQNAKRPTAVDHNALLEGQEVARKRVQVSQSCPAVC
jgi:hypothetical protein